MSRVRTVASTEILLVVGLVLFVGVARVVERIVGIDGPVHLGPVMALLLSAVPAALWIVYFYLQDRHEPEPKHFVVGVYLLGAFVAAPIAGFAIDLVAQEPVGAADYRPLAAHRILWAILVIGVAQETCKYVVVRYSVYMSAQLDEPLDAIIYMTAAGIGFATHANYQALKGLEGVVYLTTGCASAVVTTLAHACFAGVLGYAMGVAKFSTASPHRRSLYLVAGLIVAAGLNGQFSLLQRAVTSSAMEVQPWRGLAHAAGFAAIVFLVTSLLMRRHLAASPHREERGQ